MKMKPGVCEAPMRHSGQRCALRSGHRGAHELNDDTEYFLSEYDGSAAGIAHLHPAGTSSTHHGP